jgi:hypothetical protein
MRLVCVLLLLAGCDGKSKPLGEATKALDDAAKTMGDATKTLAKALATDVAVHVTGNIHSVGGELGTWDIVLGDCQSGERNGFYGADFYVAGDDNLRLRYVHDEAVGDVVKVVYPTKMDTAIVFDRSSKCAVLEGAVQRSNITTKSWNHGGAIRHVNGHMKLDCRHTDGKGRVTGEVTFTNCH